MTLRSGVPLRKQYEQTRIPSHTTWTSRAKARPHLSCFWASSSPLTAEKFPQRPNIDYSPFNHPLHSDKHNTYQAFSRSGGNTSLIPPYRTRNHTQVTHLPLGQSPTSVLCKVPSTQSSKSYLYSPLAPHSMSSGLLESRDQTGVYLASYGVVD